MTKYRRHTTNSNQVAIRKPAKTTTCSPVETESGHPAIVVVVEDIYKTILRKLKLDELTVVTAVAHQNRDNRAAELYAIAEKLTQYAKDLVLPWELFLMVLVMKEDSIYATKHNNQLPENGVRWREILQEEYSKHCCNGYVCRNVGL